MIVYANVSTLSKSIAGWNAEATAMFIFTLGRIGNAQSEFWKKRGIRADRDVVAVLKRQRLILLEVAGFAITSMSIFVMLANYFMK
jgi:hypothetical protein